MFVKGEFIVQLKSNFSTALGTRSFYTLQTKWNPREKAPVDAFSSALCASLESLSCSEPLL